MATRSRARPRASAPPAAERRHQGRGRLDRREVPRVSPPPRSRPALPEFLHRYRAPEHLRGWLVNGAILYSTSDEDSLSELRALRIGPQDRVLSVTGSGCRTLSLLIDRPARLVSVDASPLQNFLLELKIAAIRHLDHGDFLAFLGVRDDDRRGATYSSVRGDLSAGARAFWDLNRRVIDRGIVYSGAHETYYRRSVATALNARRRMVRELFSFEDLDAQRDFYHRRWNNWLWRGAFLHGVRPSLYKLLLPDPSYVANVELEGETVGQYLHRRFEHAFTHFLARDSHWMAMVILGRYHSERALPPYMCAEHYETVRAGLDAVEIRTAPLTPFLEAQPPGSFDNFSLSDISGWTSPREFENTLEAVVHTGRRGARFCYRNFLTKRSIPARLHSQVEPDDGLAAELEDTDLAFCFSFQVGTILGVAGDAVTI